MRRATSVAAPVAHLVGPGKLKVVNGQLAYAAHEQPGPIRLDPRALRAVYCYGPVGVTDDALQVLFAHEIEVAWLSPTGARCRGRLVRSDPPRTALRVLQHRALADPELRRQWAAAVVAAKIESHLKAARHYQRQGRVGPDVLTRLQELRERCPSATTDQVRGIEGAASALWFAVLGGLFKPPWVFTQRTRRPPLDPVNALLSLGYTWLLARTVARCEAAGLEVNLGGLHEYRPGRPSLACDVMEPLRTPAVDRWVVTLCNQNHVAPDDFVTEGSAGVRLQPGKFPGILRLWEEHWLSQEQDAELDGRLGELIAWLRRGMTAADIEAGSPPDEAH